MSEQQQITVLQMCSYLHSNVFHARFFDAMAKNIVDQIVASPHSVPTKNRPASTTITTHYGAQERWSLSRKLFYSWKIRDYATHLTKLRNIDSVDVVHAHSLYADGLLAHNICTSRKLPLIVTIRDGDIALFPKYYPHWKNKARAVVEAADKIIFVNPNFKEYFEKSHQISLSNVQCEVIPNGVDEIWHETSLPTAANSNVTRLICVAKLIPRKNQLGLIKAIKLAHKISEKHFTLTLVGKPIASYGRSVLKECKKHNWITYLGELNPPEIIDQFHHHDLFALVSHTENFGIVYAEALACGLPLLYSRDQGFDGWSHSVQYGSAVSSRNTHSIANGLINFDFELPSAVKRKQLSKDLFSWSKVATQHESIYKSVVDN